MKVLHFSPHSIISGTERHVLVLTEGLLGRGLEVEVLVPLDGPLVERLRALGVPVHILEWRSRKLRGIFSLVAQIRRGKYDIVHSHAYSRLPCLAAKLARVKGTVESRHIPGREPAGRRRGLLQRLRDRAFNGCIDQVIAVSDEIKETAVAQGVPAERVSVINNGFPVARVRPVSDAEARRKARDLFGVADGDFVVGAAARLSPEKGVQVLIRAMSRVADPAVRCVVIGCGPQEAELRDQTRALGLESRVRFLGYRDDVLELLAGFDCYILASLYEGFSMGLLEALAAGVPPIVSDQPASVGTLGDEGAGLVAATGDAEDLARQIVTLAGDRRLWERLSVGARTRIGAFTVDRMIDRTLEVYRRVLDGCGRSAPQG